jgi:hypothetical protein
LTSVNEPGALFLNDGFLDARHFEETMAELPDYFKPVAASRMPAARVMP